MALPPPSAFNERDPIDSFRKFSEKNLDFKKVQNSQKTQRGFNGRNWILVIFGFSLTLLVESLFIYAVVWILRDAEIVSWRLSLRDVVTLSAVTLLWRAFHRSIFLASHKQ